MPPRSHSVSSSAADFPQRPLGRHTASISEPTDQSAIVAQHGSHQAPGVAWHRHEAREINPSGKSSSGHRGQLIVTTHVRFLELVPAVLPPEHPPAHRARHHRRPDRMANPHLGPGRDIQRSPGWSPIQPAFADQHRLAVCPHSLAHGIEDQFIQVASKRMSSVRMHLTRSEPHRSAEAWARR